MKNISHVSIRTFSVSEMPSSVSSHVIIEDLSVFGHNYPLHVGGFESLVRKKLLFVTTWTLYLIQGALNFNERITGLHSVWSSDMSHNLIAKKMGLNHHKSTLQFHNVRHLPLDPSEGFGLRQRQGKLHHHHNHDP